MSELDQMNEIVGESGTAGKPGCGDVQAGQPAVSLEDKARRAYEKRKKQELDGLTGMEAEQADWEEGLEDDEDE